LSGTKVAISEPNTRHRITGRGSAIWTGNVALGADPALVQGPGLRMFWYPFKRAFRAGETSSNRFDESQIGLHSVGMGLDTLALGDRSVALGEGTQALGRASAAIGRSVAALAEGSINIGAFQNVQFPPTIIENPYPYSLMVAFNSLVPGLFVAEGADSGGTVGIGTAETGDQRLLVAGDTTIDGQLTIGSNLRLAGQLVRLSDVRAKRNIRPLQGALDLVKKLQGIRFDWEPSETASNHGEDIGFSAQQVESVLPELVSEAPGGLKGVAYEGVTPVLVEAIKEQQNLIEEQRSELSALRSELDRIQLTLRETLHSQ